MKKYRTRRRTEEVLAHIVCNKCSKELKEPDQDSYITINHVFGYFSNKDGQLYDFDLCEDCFDVLVSELQIKPHIMEGYL